MSTSLVCDLNSSEVEVTLALFGRYPYAMLKANQLNFFSVNAARKMFRFFIFIISNNIFAHYAHTVCVCECQQKKIVWREP